METTHVFLPLLAESLKFRGSLSEFALKIRDKYGTHLDKIGEKLWDRSRGHLGASLINRTCVKSWKAAQNVQNGKLIHRSFFKWHLGSVFRPISGVFFCTKISYWITTLYNFPIVIHDAASPHGYVHCWLVTSHCLGQAAHGVGAHRLCVAPKHRC